MTNTSDDEHKLLNPYQVANMLQVSIFTLRGWRQKGRGPRCIRLNSRTVRYRKTDVMTWLAEREQKAG